MVLFHVSPLLPLLRDYLNAIQQPWSKASVRLHTSQALSTWGDKWMGLLSQPAQTPQLCSAPPRLPLPSANHRHTPGQACPRNRPEHMGCRWALRK